MTRVLVVDDESQIRRALRTSLEAHGYEVRTASNGEEAIVAAAETALDLVFLDLGLPDLDGTDVIRRVRSFSEVPVIVLSVRDRQADKVAALDAGADDYVTKPFGMEEVLARLRAALRRSPADQAEPATLDVRGARGRSREAAGEPRRREGPPHQDRVRAPGSARENPGKLLTHQWLLRRVWGPGYASESHYLRVYVRAIRRKLGDAASAPRLILTEPGVGYRWIGDESPPVPAPPQGPPAPPAP